MNILSTLEENEFETGFIKTGSILFDDFYFADDIQINWINYFAKKHNLTVKEILKKIVIISGRITFLLNLVVNQFLKISFQNVRINLKSVGWLKINHLLEYIIFYCKFLSQYANIKVLVEYASNI